MVTQNLFDLSYTTWNDFSRRFCKYFFEKQSCEKPDREIVQTDDSFVLMGHSGIVPRAHVKSLQDRTAGKFCQVKSGSIKGASQKCRKAFQLFVYRQNQGCTAINGEHKKRGSAFHGSISRSREWSPVQRISRHRPVKPQKRKGYFFICLVSLGKMIKITFPFLLNLCCKVIMERKRYLINEELLL